MRQSDESRDFFQANAEGGVDGRTTFGLRRNAGEIANRKSMAHGAGAGGGGIEWVSRSDVRGAGAGGICTGSSADVFADDVGGSGDAGNCGVWSVATWKFIADDSWGAVAKRRAGAGRRRLGISAVVCGVNLGFNSWECGRARPRFESIDRVFVAAKLAGIFSLDRPFGDCRDMRGSGVSRIPAAAIQRANADCSAGNCYFKRGVRGGACVPGMVARAGDRGVGDIVWMDGGVAR